MLTHAGREVVGRKIAVWKPKAGVWRNGTVSDFNGGNLRHMVRSPRSAYSKSMGCRSALSCAQAQCVCQACLSNQACHSLDTHTRSPPEMNTSQVVSRVLLQSHASSFEGQKCAVRLQPYLLGARQGGPHLFLRNDQQRLI